MQSRPSAGPEQVIRYLGRYTHRVAISNHRLIAFDDDHVRFRWRDYAGGNKTRTMMVTADEFIRRFLLHVLPKGFVRIRHFGIMANYLTIRIDRFVPKVARNDTAGPFNRQRSDNAILLVPHLSEPSDRHPEADGRPTVLEDLIERFRQYLLAVLQSGFFDVLWHACADVCLPTRATTFPIAAALISPENLRPATSASPPAVRAAGLAAPHLATTSTAFPYFFHSLTASAANTSGFKSRYRKSSAEHIRLLPWHGSPRISDER
jgi:Putative transposase